LELAGAKGYPRLPLRPVLPARPESIIGGIAAWHLFVERADDASIGAALPALDGVFVAGSWRDRRSGR
jgi:hypothetical protein